VARFGIKDPKTLEVNAWWKKARDIDLWSEIIREAKVHKGLQHQRRKIKSIASINNTATVWVPCFAICSFYAKYEVRH
jgi:hypothetical protein